MKAKLSLSPYLAGLILSGIPLWFSPGSIALAEQPTITKDNWTELVGFKPDPIHVNTQQIDRNNLKEFLALIPPGMKVWIETYKFTMQVQDYQPIVPSSGYIDATNQNQRKAKLTDIGEDYRRLGLEGHVAGLPFPKPTSGDEAAWDYYFAYIGDDNDQYYTVYWISANSGLEHQESWRWAAISRISHRTDLDPKPLLRPLSDKGYVSASITYALSPYDKKGFGALYFEPMAPLDIVGHVYVPAMRRVLRNSFGTRGDTWNATDLLLEDVRGYLGRPEWMYWKLVGKETRLLSMHAAVPRGKQNNVENLFDLKDWPHWNPRVPFEPRPVYVLEATPRIPDYPYSKMIIYLDAETFLIPYKEVYDKKGELWKIILNGYNAPSRPGSSPPEFGIVVAIDLQSEHATLFDATEVFTNGNLKESLFTLSSLRKRGK